MQRPAISKSKFSSLPTTKEDAVETKPSFIARIAVFLILQVVVLGACFYFFSDGQLLQLLRSRCVSSNSGATDAFVPVEFETCILEEVGGREKDNYGSWPLCTNQVPSANATVYSFGIGRDASFDIAMISKGAQVFAFDPTITPEEAKALFPPEKADLFASFHFMQVGLGDKNGVIRFLQSRDKRIQSMTSVAEVNNYQDVGFQAAVLTLPTVMAALKHDHVDLLKVDIEGAEFVVCESEEFLDALASVQQVAYEFHERLLKEPGQRLINCSRSLQARGFTDVYHKGNREEFVFSRMRPDGKVENRLPEGKGW